MTEKRAAAAILFFLFLCIPFSTVYGEDSSAVYYCSTIQDLSMRLEEYPGSTLVLTDDIEVAETWNLYSSKRKGFGIGMHSVRTIVEAHGGLISFEAEEHVFKASVLIPLKS